MEQMELVGELVKKRRERASLSQPELADRASIGRAYLSQVETLKVLPSEEYLTKVAKALGDDPGLYVRTLRREKFLKKEPFVFTDRSTRHKLELSNLEYLLDLAEISFQYFGFSCVVFVSNFYEKLIEFMNRGGMIRLVLAEPNLRNLVKRAREGVENRIEDRNWKHIILRTEQEHDKLMLVFGYLEELRFYHQKMVGSFELSLDPDYRPKERFTIIDNSFCLHRPTYESGDSFSFSVTTKDSPEFTKLQEQFMVTEHRAKLMPWDCWRETYKKYSDTFINEADVKKAWNELESSQTTSSSRRKAGKQTN